MPSNVHVITPSVLAVPCAKMILLVVVLTKFVIAVCVRLQVLAVLLVSRRPFWRIVVPRSLQKLCLVPRMVHGPRDAVFELKHIRCWLLCMSCLRTGKLPCNALMLSRATW